MTKMYIFMYVYWFVHVSFCNVLASQVIRFSFQKETRKFACFKESKNAEFALIHIQEVFLTNLEINDNHQMDIANYRMLTCSAYY